jgi:hypothetical protein
MTRALAALAVLASLAGPVRAQMGGPCMMTELAKLCPGMAPGSAEFSACSRTKAGEAAAACQGGGAAAKNAPAGGKSPCAEDMKKYCPGLWPGTPEFSSCMSSHMGDVTPECADFGRKQMGKHEKMKPGDAACVADAKKLCPGLTGTDGPKFMSCMTAHYDKLSPLCQKQFKGAKDDGMVDCSEAMKKLCPDAELGSPEMTKCSIEHKDELPASCRKKGKKGKK